MRRIPAIMMTSTLIVAAMFVVPSVSWASEPSQSTQACNPQRKYCNGRTHNYQYQCANGQTYSSTTYRPRSQPKSQDSQGNFQWTIDQSDLQSTGKPEMTALGSCTATELD